MTKRKRNYRQVKVDGRSGFGRRVSELRRGLERDLGGAEQLSTTAAITISNLATLQAELEQWTAAAAKGAPVDDGRVRELRRDVVRLLGRLGLERVADESAESLADYAARRRQSGASA